MSIERHVAEAEGADLRRARWMWRVGQILLLAGPLMVLGLLNILALLFPSLDEFDLVSSILGFVVAPLLFLLSTYLGFALMYRAKQYRARARVSSFTVDPRPPVVYLRPFTADQSVRGLFGVMLRNTGIWPWFFSVEEQLVEAVGSIGPVVAIGKPGEQLPTPGAVRRYADDRTWQHVVGEWIAAARLIVLRSGMSEGLWWELKQAVALGRPERILVLVLRMKRSDYLTFSQVVNDRLGITLPRFNAISRWRRASGFVEFDAAWQPRFLPLKAPLLRTEHYMPLRSPFVYALQSTYARLGVDWRPPPLSRVRLFVIGTLLFCVAAVSAMYVFDSMRSR